MLVKQSDDFYVNCYSRSSGVTGSCNLLSIHFPNGKNFRVLIDCGLFQGSDDTGYRNYMVPFNAEKIDSVFITHNHIDHTGLLPLLVRQGYQNEIFTTYDTARLIDVALYDSCKIKNDDIGTALYTQEDVGRVIGQIVGCRYKTIIKPHKYVHAIMYSNGHLVGAATIFMNIKYPGRDDINLVFTGDYNNKNVFFNVENLPKRIRDLKISALFTESTYGNMDSNDPRLRPCLKENIINAINNGKTIVFPAFAQGRYQEILLLLKKLQDANDIPTTIPIWLDGYTGQEYTKRYLYMDLGIKKFAKNFMPKNAKFIPYKGRRIIRQKLIDDPRSKIIISPGGMGNYGSIQKYISNYISKENVLIHYLGYCSPESRASELINASYGEEVTYAGMSYIKRCEVKWSGEFSAHAKRNELLNFTKQFSNLNSVLITHGEPEVRKEYAKYLLKNLSESVQIGILEPEYVYHINSEGVSTFTSNFEL